MADPGVVTKRLLAVILVGSGAFTAALFWSYFRFDSQLAFAQAADSLVDIFTAGMLLWTVALAAKPEDWNHPFGHHRAEPLGALVVAVLAGVLAVEVAKSAVDALLGHAEPDLTAGLLWLFAAKAAFKGVVILVARVNAKRTDSPALKAIVVDARNDALTSTLAVAGGLLARFGGSNLDAWLALPMAGWIFWAGVDLARENISLLMGEAPSEKRQAELVELASRIPGVRAVHDLKAHHLGTLLQVKLHVVVADDLTVKQAHDIGEAARLRLEQEPDVGHAWVHIDVE